MKAPLVLYGSPAVHLRVLAGRGVFGAELQRLEEVYVSAFCPKELQYEHREAQEKPIKTKRKRGIQYSTFYIHTALLFHKLS